MITLALSATVGAPTPRVWRALVDPAERLVWDERVLGEVSPAAGKRQARASKRLHLTSAIPKAAAPPPLRTTRWRFRLGGVPLVMVERILQAEPGQRIVSKIVIGSMQFEQTLTLHPEQDETGRRTRVGMKLVAQNRVAVIGEVVPRSEVQKIVIEYIDSTLRQLQKHCEAEASESELKPRAAAR
ncbi:MAG: SRPBCC family protein [Myxococcota bacterium]